MANTLKRLDQGRLNVISKSRVNPLAWRGQFTPQLVDYLLESFSEPGDLVVDPFSGSGTVLFECASRDITCFGNELNPAAYLMSKFFHMVNFEIPDREVILEQVRQPLNGLVGRYRGLPLMNPADNHRQKYSNLLALAKDLISATSDYPMPLCLAANILFRAESSRISDLRQAVWRSYDYIAAFARELPYTTSSVDAQLGDARSVHKALGRMAGLVVTSPPYINVFNYHQNHRAIVELLDWDLLRVARSEIGSNRRNRGNRFRTVIQYCLDMSEFLDAMSTAIRQDGNLVLIVGRESRVRGVPFYNGKIIRDLVRLHPCFTRLGHYERRFTNRFGVEIREDVLVTKRGDVPSQNLPREKVRRIAGRHLKAAGKVTSDEVNHDLESAMEDVLTFPGSEIYATRENPIERSGLRAWKDDPLSVFIE